VTLPPIPFALSQIGPDDIPPGVLEIVKIFFTTVIVISLGIPVIRALVRRFERGPLLPPQQAPDTTARLERIEQAIEAVAIEVERIAEAQRFSAKLMAEQQRNLPRSSTSS
jgi:hypothetical protein